MTRCADRLRASIPLTLAVMLLVPSASLAGCATGALVEEREGTPGGPGGPGGPDSASWTLEVDTSATERYLPLDTTSASVRGQVIASLGAERAEIGAETSARSVAVDGGGAFTSSAMVEPGLSHVEIRGYDSAGHEARGDRAILRADYLPEGDMNDGAIAIAVTDELLQGIADGALGAVGSLDLTGFITPGTPLLSDDRCTIIADSVTAGTPTISLSSTADGRLRAIARVPDIAVGIHGNCNLLGNSITIRPGSEADETTVEISMILEPRPVAPGECLRGFTASDVNTRLATFDLDLRLSGCGLLCLFGELVGEIAEGAVQGMLEDRIGGMVGGVIDPLLADLSVLDVETSLDFLGAPVDVGICMTSLGPEEGQLVAGLGARASGGGELSPVAAEAPGAPLMPVMRDAVMPGTMVMDPGLIGQILFSVWRGGALHLEDLTAGEGGGAGGIPLNVDSLAILVPQLRAMISEGVVPAGAPLRIDLDGTLAPLVRGADADERAAGVDLFIEIGDLEISIGAGTHHLFLVSTTVRLALALVPDAAGALVPTLLPEETSSTTFVRSTTIPAMPAAIAARLAGFVDGLIPTQLDTLLAGAAITLPDVGAPLMVSDVRALEGGYLEIYLGGVAPPEGELGEPPLAP